jgi:ADP-ribosylglycohydrolase
LPGEGDRLVGAILGQALGDALGFVVEAEPPEVAREYVEGCLRAGRAGTRSSPNFSFGQYSDDTQLARELLRSVLDAGGWNPAAFASRLADLFREGRDVGAGPGTRDAAFRLIAGVPWDRSGTPAPYAGNGSAMRAAPLGLVISERSAMCRAGREQSRITHMDTRCAAGAVTIARAVALAAAPGPLEITTFLGDLSECAGAEDEAFGAAIRDLASWVPLDAVAAARHVHETRLDPAHGERWQGISAFVVPSVLWSLYAFARSPDDYWETICTAIGVGGDTDTLAAMAGAISGARAGIGGLPRPLVDRVHDRSEWDAAALTQLARDVASLPREG